MRWIMALLLMALLIVVVLWPTRQPAGTLPGSAGSQPNDGDETADQFCVNPELDDRREVIRNSMERVERLVDRYHKRRRIQYKSMQMRSRVVALERALDVGESRTKVIRAIQESLHEEMQLNKLSSSSVHWKVAGLAPSDAILDSVMKTIEGRIDTSLPSLRYVDKEDEVGRFFVEFLSPQPKQGLSEQMIMDLVPLPELPDKADAEVPCWNPLESEELAWRLAEARIVGMLGDNTLIEDNQEKQRLSERLEKLTGQIMRDPDAAEAEKRGNVVLEILGQHTNKGTVEPSGVRRFHGVMTQAYRVNGQGDLLEAIGSINAVSNAGAIVGRVEICRLGVGSADLMDAKPDDFDADCVWSDGLPRFGSFAYRFDAHVLARRAQAGR